MKFKEWLDTWLENYVKPHLKTRTTESYARIIEKKISDEIGEKELSELTARDVDSFVSKLLKSGNVVTKEGLAASSVNTVITVMQSSLKKAVELGYLQNNVASGASRPKIKFQRVACFDDLEQEKIERAILSGEQIKMFGVLLCLYTGIRLGELLALQWDDVDFENGSIRINKTCHDSRMGQGFGRVTNAPQTAASNRIIPLPKQLIPVTEEVKRTATSDFVVSFRGKPPTIRGYQKRFASFLKKIGVKHKGFHALRHTFEKRALDSGMDAKTLAEILGRKSAAIDLERYNGCSAERKAEMMNALGNLRFSKADNA